MPTKLSANTIKLENTPSIVSYAGVVGKKEGEGPLGQYFDYVYEDTTLSEKTWEKSESKLQQNCLNIALDKKSLASADIDFLFAGDLLNQCIGSCFGLKDFNIPFLGLYGACSTMAESLCLASLFVDSKIANRAAALTSSHFCSAERQFRFPLEYGGQRTPTAQWTVTGSGSAIVGKCDQPPYVKGVTIGKIIDYDVKDMNNMGAAMAPAAAYTIQTYLTDTQTTPSDYDLILTGDLGIVGSILLCELLKKDSIDISNVHNDCGKLIYDIEKQDVHAGGSGCGCGASVLCGYILEKIKTAAFKNVLFVATGALMSPTSSQQGESIPSIAHLVHISNEK
ncbi:MAG: stage V sporulation protein AD [Oscillospiraceae bacterium]